MNLVQMVMELGVVVISTLVPLMKFLVRMLLEYNLLMVSWGFVVVWVEYDLLMVRSCGNVGKGVFLFVLLLLVFFVDKNLCIAELSWGQGYKRNEW